MKNIFYSFQLKTDRANLHLIESIIEPSSLGLKHSIELLRTFSHVGACSALLRYAHRGCGYILPSLRSRP